MTRAILIVCFFFFGTERITAESNQATTPSRPPQSNAKGREQRKLLILVNVDTLRADRLGAYGSPLKLTPAIDALASAGVTFENAYAASNHTRPSVASLLTGLYPSSHGFWFDDSTVVSEPNLATLFRKKGWTTLWINANPNTGVFRKSFQQGWGEWKFGDQVYFRASEVVPIVEAQIAGADSSSPLFIYLQLADPHGPYTPASYRHHDLFAGDSILDKYRFRDLLPGQEPATKAEIKNAFNRYNAEIREMDRALEPFLAKLAHRFDLSVIVTADHGESFGENGVLSHGSSVQEEQIRVPLIFWAESDRFRRGERVTSVVSHVDVLPTLRDTLKIPAAKSEAGVSLLPLLENDGVFERMRTMLRLTDREILVETKYSVDYFLKTYRPELYERWRKFDLTPLGRAIIWRSALGPIWKSTRLSHKLAVFRVVAYRMQDNELSQVSSAGETPAKPDDSSRERWAKINRRFPMDLKPVPPPTAEQLKILKSLGYIR